MPKETRRRVETQNLGTEIASQQGGIYAPTQVRAKQSNTDFGALGNFVQTVQQRKREKLDNTLYEQGRFDANAETVDPERLEDEAYVKGLNSQTGVNDATKAAATLPQSLQDAMQTAKDEGTLGKFDLDEFINEHMNGFVKEESDPFYLKGLNDKAAAIQSIGSKVYEQFVAQAEDEQINFTAIDTVNSQLATIPDGNVPQGFFKNLDTTLDNLGTNLDERHDAMFKGITHALDMGNIAGAEAAAEHLLSKGKAVNGKYGSKLEKQIAIAKARQEAAEKEAKKVSDLEKARTRRAFEDTVGTEDFNMAAIDEALEAGVITPEQNVSLYKRHQIEMEKRNLQAANELDYTWFDENPSAVPFLLTDSKATRAYSEHLDKKVQQGATTLFGYAQQINDNPNNLELVEDLEVLMNEEVSRMSDTFRSAQASGHTPTFVSQVLNSATLDSPTFQSIATLARVLENKMGDTPFADVDLNKMASISNYNLLVDKYNYTPEIAKEVLKQAQEVPDAQITPVLFSEAGKEAFLKQVEDLMEGEQEMIKGFWNDIETDIGKSATAVNAIKDLSKIYFRIGGVDERDAIQLAVKRFTSTHMPVGKAWIPNKHVPEGFPEAFKARMENDFPDEDFDELVIVPDHTISGGFSVYRDGRILRDQEGQMYESTYYDIVTSMSELDKERQKGIVDESKRQSKEDAIRIEAFKNRLKELEDEQFTRRPKF